jgi:asparagine synthase (glutamine-hydrolysing)
MCGLVAIFDTRGQRPIDPALLKAMNDALTHRGPDDEGFYEDAGVGLGHRRLSIIDLASGHQPLFNEDRTVAVVYNGEIYNFTELMAELRDRGHCFRTRCDTEVIVHAWEEWGARCVEKFRGMFAFALYDAKAQQLFLGRDRLGIKPLYYARVPDGRVLVASELKALLACPDLPREIDPQAVEDYVGFGYVPDPRAIYRHVAKLEPGHTLTIERGQHALTPKRYWDVTFDGDAPSDAVAAASELRARLTEAVDMRLVAEVPLGAFLSGGVDSSAVAAAMARSRREPIDTCSIRFGETDYDESRYAAMVAERYGTRHHTRTVDPDDIDLLAALPNVYDEPFADSSALPTFRLCEAARAHVKVALSGDGGDEVFGGYRRYRWHHYEELVRRRLPGGLRRPLFGMLGAAYPDIAGAPKAVRAKSTLQAIARDSADAYFQSVCVVPDAVREALYTPAFKRDLQGYRARDLLAQRMADAPTDHHLARVQYADMKTYLPGDILTKVDRASMAHGLEVRVPILDHSFVEWAGRLDPRLKLNGREGKQVFKRALEPWLPGEVLYRPKMGFAIPLKSWFRGPMRSIVEQRLTRGRLVDSGYFDPDRVTAMVSDHMTGTGDYSQPIWALLMFAGFLEQVDTCTRTAPHWRLQNRHRASA